MLDSPKIFTSKLARAFSSKLRKNFTLLKFYLAMCLHAQAIDTKTSLIPYDEVSTFTEQNIQQASEAHRARIESGSFQIEADEIQYSYPNGEVHAFKHVSAIKPPYRMIAEELHYNPHDASANGQNLHLGKEPWYLKATHSVINENNINAQDITLYFHEPGPFSLNAKAKNLNFLQSQNFEAENVYLCLGSIPLLYLPRAKFSLNPTKFKLKLKMGHEKPLGCFMQSKIPVYTSQYGYVNYIFDAYARRGIGCGSEISFANPSEKLPWSLYLQGISLWDHKPPWENFYQKVSARNRGIINFSYQQSFFQRLHLMSHIHWWTDSKVLRDFYEKRYEQDPLPDHFIEGNYNYRNALMTLFLRKPLHRFQNSLQRLPSLRFEYFPSKINNTPLYHQGFLDFSSLRRENREETFQESRKKKPISLQRAEIAYQILWPISWDNFLTFTPLIGFRGTHYTTTSPQKSSSQKLLTQFGFDINFYLHRSLDITHEFWNIHGLRHIVHPILQYRWIPDLRQNRHPVYAIDAFQSRRHPPLLDLLERRDIDQVHNLHVLRIGIENFLQTNMQSCPQDLMVLNLYQDIHLRRPINPQNLETSPTHLHHLSDTYIDFWVSPASFLTLKTYSRFSPISKNWEEISTDLLITSADHWKLQVWNRFLRKHTQDHGVKVSGALNSLTRWEVFFQWNARLHRCEEHHYTFIREISHTWELMLKLNFRHYEQQKRDIIFSITCELLQW